MKPSDILFATMMITLMTACTLRDDGIDPDDDCLSNLCVCPANKSCEQTCDEGAPECHVQGTPGRAVDVQCDQNGECHVECAQATSCEVACGGSGDCHVTCPATGCTVTECVGDCVVSCGITGRDATRNGTTATCP